MAWIESHQALEKHPKTYDLMAFTGWNLDTAIGKLHRFWWWCVDYAEDGDLRKHNDARLGAAVGLNGEQAAMFVKAMVEACWLDRKPYFRVHDWWDYIGKFLQIKYKHTPEKWQRIKALYAVKQNSSKGGSKGRSKTPNQPNLPTDLNQPNLPDEEESVEVRLSKVLLSLILNRNPSFKEPDIGAWAKDMDAILRLDKRPADEMEKVIRWCQSDGFWQNNILSPGKLRKQYDQLKMKMGSSNGTHKSDNQAARTKAGGVAVNADHFAGVTVRFDEDTDGDSPG